MTDRELLELAAKAAGIHVPEESPWGGVNATDGVWKDISPGGDGTRHSRWNPLTEDGDALRLAVKLELAPSIFATSGLTFCTATNKPMSEVNIEEEHNGDPYAATRRAIVRAAAEIAKAGEPKCVVEKVSG